MGLDTLEVPFPDHCDYERVLAALAQRSACAQVKQIRTFVLTLHSDSPVQHVPYHPTSLHFVKSLQFLVPEVVVRDSHDGSCAECAMYLAEQSPVQKAM